MEDNIKMSVLECVTFLLTQCIAIQSQTWILYTLFITWFLILRNYLYGTKRKRNWFCHSESMIEWPWWHNKTGSWMESSGLKKLKRTKKKPGNGILSCWQHFSLKCKSNSIVNQIQYFKHFTIERVGENFP